MADHSEPTEKPTQGIFIGNLALGLLILAVVVAAIGLITGWTHTPA